MSHAPLDAALSGSTPANAWAGSYALPDSRRSPSLARELVAQALTGWPSATVEDALLLTSELVTNAVQHADSMLVLHLTVTATGWRVSVEDLSCDAPQRRAGTAHGESGRGLLLLDALAARWNWQPTPTGKSVWFELDAVRTS